MNKKEKLESTVARYFKKDSVLFTSRGSLSLYGFLKVNHYQHKKILVSANVCPIVVRTILLSENIPVLVDIDNCGTINPFEVEKINDPEVVGLICVYAYGNSLDIKKTKTLCEQKNWFLIEDVAQALGTECEGGIAGSFSEVTLFSFGIGKQIDVGMGGGMAFRNPDLKKECEKFLENEIPIKEASFNPEILTTLQISSIFQCPLNESFYDSVLAEFENYPIALALRKTKAARLFSLLDSTHCRVYDNLKTSSWWRFNIYVDEAVRNRLLNHLKSNQIKATSYFDSVYHSFPNANLEIHSSKNSDQRGKEMINLWAGAQTEMSDLDLFAQSIHDFFN